MKITDKKEKMIKIVHKLERKKERTEDTYEKKSIDAEIYVLRKKINNIVDKQRIYSGLSSADMIKKYPYY